MNRPQERYEELAQRLQQLHDDMAELGVDLLRDAVESGSGRRPPGEKLLARSRTAVARAAALIDQAATEAEGISE